MRTAPDVDRKSLQPSRKSWCPTEKAGTGELLVKQDRVQRWAHACSESYRTPIRDFREGRPRRPAQRHSGGISTTAPSATPGRPRLLGAWPPTSSRRSALKLTRSRPWSAEATSPPLAMRRKVSMGVAACKCRLRLAPAAATPQTARAASAAAPLQATSHLLLSSAGTAGPERPACFFCMTTMSSSVSMPCRRLASSDPAAAPAWRQWAETKFGLLPPMLSSSSSDVPLMP
mmetsp:Transcript_35859/g.94972  ORF Transcript_35859/g.94972 Transcript_35859/m.94972 type:complete len:231 (-) Transcript_35859:1175-1867(-)